MINIYFLTRRYCSLPALVLALLAGATSPGAFAADEIQVYNGDLRAAGESGVEIHLNYATKGERVALWAGQIPTHHALNLTPEFSWHLTDNMDWGIYVPTTRDADANWFGNGIKGRIKYISTRGSEDDKTFWGVNLEVARNRITVSESKWSTELRGILGVETPVWAVTGNVMLGNDWSGPGRSNTPDLGVNGSVLRKIDSQWSVGLEHHAALGKINDLQPWSKSEQTSFLVGNYEGKGWGLHVGIGRNWTDIGDKTVVKAIVGIDF
ncbi:MAG: hypothetical protein NT159_15050 [Proteobacteria bacterium]|nr:hypothetical protein [Pseudomonadota bacterium]